MVFKWFVIFAVVCFTFPGVGLWLWYVQHIFRMMKVTAAIRTWSDFAVEADQAVVVSDSIILAYIIEYAAFIELGQVMFKVEFSKIVDISCIFRGPAIGVLQK